jgi:hypothetical protein
MRIIHSAYAGALFPVGTVRCAVRAAFSSGATLDEANALEHSIPSVSERGRGHGSAMSLSNQEILARAIRECFQFIPNGISFNISERFPHDHLRKLRR